jgi:hypothetical protein
MIETNPVYYFSVLNFAFKLGCKLVSVIFIFLFLLPNQTVFAQFPSTKPKNSINLDVKLGSNANDLNKMAHENAMKMMQNSTSATEREGSIREFNESSRQYDNDVKSKIVLRQNQEIRFKIAFEELLKMYSGSEPYELKRAVFITEFAALEGQLDYEIFKMQISAKVKSINFIMGKEKISSNDLGKNFAIQKLYSEGVKFDKEPFQPPLAYDFDDPFGDKDRSKLLVSKLLTTGTGQCYSMPMLYLILAEEIKAKAWISLAPEHSFIVFQDSAKGQFYNFETTNGYITSDKWVMASGYINSNALKSKIYLDTLGKNAILARCLAELHYSYISKFGYNELAVHMIGAILNINPKGIEGYLLKANYLRTVISAEARRLGINSKNKFSNYPDIYNLYKELQELESIITDKGYAHIPKEKYEAWRTSTSTNKSIKSNGKN